MRVLTAVCIVLSAGGEVSDKQIGRGGAQVHVCACRAGRCLSSGPGPQGGAQLNSELTALCQAKCFILSHCRSRVYAAYLVCILLPRPPTLSYNEHFSTPMSTLHESGLLGPRGVSAPMPRHLPHQFPTGRVCCCHFFVIVNNAVMDVPGA